LQKLLNWNAQQVEQRVTKKYEPIAKQYEADQKIATATPRAHAQHEQAQKWPLSKESEQEILAELKRDQSVTLEGAYVRVVVPKLHTDRNKTRQEVLDEINKQPRSTSTSTTTAAAKPEQAMSLDDQLRAKFKRDGISLSN